MNKSKPNIDTSAIILAIETAALTAQTAAGVVRDELAEHTKHDDKRFADLTLLVTSIANDVRSLIDTRSYTRGMVKMASLVGGLVGAAVTAFLLYWRGR